MDRNRKQKIGYMLWVLVAIIMLMGIFFFSRNYKDIICEKQMQELIVIYPEMKTELQDNFAYYQKKLVQADRITLVAVIVLIIFFSGGFVWNKKREKRKEVEKITFLYEQLLEFQKGNFEIIPSLKEMSETDKWENVYEKLYELSYYFSDLKLRLAREENSTKTLITDISHQLKTPLASIRMCHELAKSSELSKEEQTDFLATEAQEIKKMEVLLDELVKLSRLENNMIQIKPEKNYLKETISEAVAKSL